MKLSALLPLFFLLFSGALFAQVAINTDGSQPDPSAMLDVKSTAKGLLLPRMTLAQRNAIMSPANGLMIYQTDNSPGFYYNSGSGASPVWVMAGTGSGWGLSGNSGTTAGVNFIGTTDNVPLTFKVNNQLAGKIDQSLLNTAFGYQSMHANTSGTFNTACGHQALFANTTGGGNTAAGYSALYSNTEGGSNTAYGAYSLFSNTTGGQNTAQGLLSLFSNTTGDYNTAVGYAALLSNNTGISNVATGYQSLYSNTGGSWNTALGNEALYYNTTGNENTAIGLKALYHNTTGEQNTGCGLLTLFLNSTGMGNCAVGCSALATNSTGSLNTAIGTYALSLNFSGDYNTAIGEGALYLNDSEYNTAVGFSASSNINSGFRNTSIGAYSLVYNTTGSYNTALGYNTGPGSNNLYNTTCVGIDATATGSDMVRLGNIYVSSIGGHADWTHIADGRFKENVKEDVPGLSFITQLRPVTYQLDREKINEFTGVTERQNKLREKDPGMKFPTGDKYTQVNTGFIAQEVEAAARKIGFDFSGVDAPKNDKDYYGLRYAEFVVPLVKAVQELNAINEAQRITNEELRSQNEILSERMEKLEYRLSQYPVK
jgi:trimeric autotransporter adhesin